jgi:hypothetical protein
MLAKHVVVLVHRDMAEIIPTTVFEHEAELLKDIHGEGKISLAEGMPDFPAIEIDAEDEFGRLMQCYGQNEQGIFYAERVFGRTSRGLEAFAHKPAKAGKKAKADQAEEVAE